MEKCGEICHVEECFHMTDFSTQAMKNVAKSVLLQFTRFCVGKTLTKYCVCGEKIRGMVLCSCLDTLHSPPAATKEAKGDTWQHHFSSQSLSRKLRFLKRYPGGLITGVDVGCERWQYK